MLTVIVHPAVYTCYVCHAANFIELLRFYYGQMNHVYWLIFFRNFINFADVLIAFRSP